MQTKKILSVLIIIIYLILLIPYTIVSNAGEAGIVIDSQEINATSLPEDVQDLLINKENSYYAILIEDQIVLEKKQVSQDKNQITKEKKLILSKENQEKDSFVKIDDIVIDLRVANNIIPVINQSFEKLIIGETGKARFGDIIETMSHYNLTPLLTFSSIDFLAGGLIVVLILTFISQRKVALWTIPAIISCYSFQFFLANLVSGMNQLEVGLMYRLFGLLFIPALPLTLGLKKFEETNEGKQKICELYRHNIKFLRGLIGTFKNID
ncbi:hypothetical protein [Candidatus Methanoperedens nitratireducens]|uniref:Uncharacterized protein n=1 Tax=Candidatus Methanoperedens nitratireducens TaxID=1392998 RepID=A0A284VLT6_9EURY|nr:hypothetical protein [Candidatus Methanoperedens nitroreducens]SNQ60241.1 membrane hypothetical protein [Candidatus Methanoperedens nitroreducens]